MDQYEAAREIKRLERYGPEVVGMCNGQGTTDLWIPGNLPIAFFGRSAEMRGFSLKMGLVAIDCLIQSAGIQQ